MTATAAEAHYFRKMAKGRLWLIPMHRQSEVHDNGKRKEDNVLSNTNLCKTATRGIITQIKIEKINFPSSSVVDNVTAGWLHKNKYYFGPDLR